MAHRFIAAISHPLFLSLAFLWLVLFAAESARPLFFLQDDNACWFLSAFVHDYRVLTETGRLAEVNYYQHGGEPFIGQGQTAVLYPPVYLGVALAKFFSRDALWSIEWIAALHLSLGLAGFYAWLRQGGVAARWAALGGLGWIFTPFVIDVGSNWIMTTFAAAWLPWIFWAFDYLLARPSARAALFLGVTVALLFLQGYVQWFAYAMLFLTFYAAFQFVVRREARKPSVLYYLFVSVMVFAILALPLLLPVYQTVGDSAVRSGKLPVDAALECSVSPELIAPAQVCLFSGLVFGATNAIIYCPALLFLPVAVFQFFHAAQETRRRIVPLFFLGLLALVFSTQCHWLLTMLPVFDKFRWPFKVFLFADFFLIALMAWSLGLWAESRRASLRIANLAALACLGVVMLANLTVSLAFHEENFFSDVSLTASVSPLPAGMDPRLGRAATFGDDLFPGHKTYRYLTHAFATYFAFPSLGGYDPLVSEAQLEYSLYQDYPNICTDTLTPDFQKDFQARSVRYWIVAKHSSEFPQVEALPGLKLIDGDEDRAIFEDAAAAPLVCEAKQPAVPLTFRYSGNSLLIPVDKISSPLSVSVGPTSGWWYRFDGGPWLQPSYRNGLLNIAPQTSARLLEVSYFDPQFRKGLLLSVLLLIVLIIMLAAMRAPAPRQSG